jgi:hypothetical protein
MRRRGESRSKHLQMEHDSRSHSNPSMLHPIVGLRSGPFCRNESRRRNRQEGFEIHYDAEGGYMLWGQEDDDEDVEAGVADDFGDAGVDQIC